MFQPPLFREERMDVMHELMRSHPFATLVTTLNGKISVDHLPLVLHDTLSPNGTIRGHISKANPLWRSGGEEREAVAIFQGPQAYVTPNWYPSKKEHGKAVPTWNYAVVHARGKLLFSTDSTWLTDHLNELTARQESHRHEPWQVSDAPSDYVTRQLKGIVGIELVIESLDGQWKVSQNKDQSDRAGVRQGLSLEGNPDADAMAELIERRGN